MAGEEFRGAPIAKGGIPAEFPSQIGVGPAQVFGPYQSTFAQDEIARDRLRASKKAAEDKAKEEKAKEHEFKPEIKGMVPESIGPYMDAVNEHYTWLKDNTDKYGEPGFETEVLERENRLLGLAEVLKQGNKDIGERDTVIVNKGEGQFENEDRLGTLRTKDYYQTIAAGDPDEISSWIDKFGVDVGGITRKPPPIDLIEEAQNTAKSVDANIGPLVSRIDPLSGDTIYERTTDEKQYRADMDANADTRWDNSQAIQKAYPLKEGETASGAWRELVWNQRERREPTPQIRAGETEGRDYTYTFNSARSKKWNFVYGKTTTPFQIQAFPFLADAQLKALNTYLKKTGKAKTTERVRIQGTSSETENKPIFIRANADGEGITAIPIQWQRQKGGTWDLLVLADLEDYDLSELQAIVGPQNVRELGNQYIITIPNEFAKEDIEGLTGMTIEQFLSKKKSKGGKAPSFQ